MAFKRMPGVDLPYEKQILIYAMCVNFKIVPKSTQDKIVRLCSRAGRQYAEALFDLVTQSETNVEGIAMKHHMSSSVLYEARKRFYEMWWKT